MDMSPREYEATSPLLAKRKAIFESPKGAMRSILPTHTSPLTFFQFEEATPPTPKNSKKKRKCISKKDIFIQSPSRYQKLFKNSALKRIIQQKNGTKSLSMFINKLTPIFTLSKFNL
jgi:hypothetical protein